MASRSRDLCLSLLARHLRLGAPENESGLKAASDERVPRAVKRALFPVDVGEGLAEEEVVSCVVEALLYHDARGPLPLLRKALLVARESPIAKQCVARCSHVIQALPAYCLGPFMDAQDIPIAHLKELAASRRAKVSTPLKKATLGSTGSDPGLRVGPRVYTEREVIRDALTQLLEGAADALELTTERVLSHLEHPANFAWTAKTVLEFYLRSSFNVTEYESLMVSSSSQIKGRSEGEVALWLTMCKRLGQHCTPMWLALLSVTVERLVESLIALDTSNVESSFLCAAFLARFLAFCSFEVFDKVAVPPHDVLETLLRCNVAASFKFLFVVFVTASYLECVSQKVHGSSLHIEQLHRFMTWVRGRPIARPSDLFACQRAAPFTLPTDHQQPDTMADRYTHLRLEFDENSDDLVCQPMFVMAFFRDAIANRASSGEL
jgi:hypothetical protein